MTLNCSLLKNIVSYGYRNLRRNISGRYICPVAHLSMVAHRNNAAINLEKSIPDNAVIVSRKKNQIKFQYNLDHGIVKMITWTLLPVND